MYKIYCLVHPVTMQPFYVGATRKTLSERLAAHVCTRNNIPTLRPGLIDERNKLFKDLYEQGLRPKIYCLFIINDKNVDYCERFFYNYIKNFGAQLIQHQSRFTYSGHHLKNK